MNSRELLQSLNDKIPLTHAMGLKVLRCDQNGVEISADFFKNKNHKNTAFGGSVNSLMTLVCWSWLSLYLENELELSDLQVVIQESHAHFLKPIVGDFSAVCVRPDKKELSRFAKTLETRRKGRITLAAHIGEDADILAKFSGRFVAYIMR